MCQKVSSKPQKPKSKKAKIESSLDTAVETLTQVCQQSLKNDEFQIFGQHVAAQLQKLPIVQALQLQEQIQTLLTRARLQQLQATFSPPASSPLVLSTSGASAASSAYSFVNNQPQSPFQPYNEESHASDVSHHTNVQFSSQVSSASNIDNQSQAYSDGETQGGLVTFFSSWQNDK